MQNTMNTITWKQYINKSVIAITTVSSYESISTKISNESNDSV